MDFVKSVKQAIEILKLNVKTIGNVAKDKEATTAGILILIISGVIGGIVSKEWFLVGVIPIMVLVFSFIGVGILHLLARIFGGKAEFIELYRVLTHASILNWLSIFNFIPILKTVISIITAIWGIIVNFVVIKNLYKLSNLKTAFVIIIPAIIVLVSGVIVFTVLMIIDPEMLASFQ